MQTVTRRGIQVFSTSFAFFFVETAFFHILHFTHNNLEATLVISYALLGLAIGALADYLLFRNRPLRFAPMALLLVISIVLAFLNITQAPGLVRFSPLLILPFVLGNLIITHSFRTENTNHIYFFDLFGASAGVLFSVVAIPLLKTENALLLCLAALCAVGWSFATEHPKTKAIRVAFPILLVAALATMVVNMNWHVLELEVIASGGGSDPIKDYARFRQRELPFILSKDSLVARVSIYQAETERRVLTYDGQVSSVHYWTCFNGESNDAFDNAALLLYRNDPRIPFMYNDDGTRYTVFKDSPRVFVIGTSAHGIVKPIKLLVDDPSHIETVEINPAIVALMQNELYDLSGRAYENLSVTTVDARTHLLHSTQQYDLITMMNTYTVQNIGYFGEPDFVHTRDAIGDYLDHLTDDGFILFEERDVNETSRYAVFKMLNNVISVLQERGWTEPERHLFVYNVSPSKARARSEWYTFIVVKKTPITADEEDYFRRWIDSRHNIEYVLEQDETPTMDYTVVYHTQLEYLGGEPADSLYARFLASDERLSFFGSEILLTPTTDDRPFIFDVYADRRAIKGLLARLGAAAAGVLLLSLGLHYFGGGKRRMALSLPHMLYFVIIGLGYFVIEVTLLKFYQSHSGSPTNALVFVLGGLLLSTGLGSFASRRYPPQKIVLSFVGIILFAAYHIFLNRPLLRLIGGPIWLHNLIIAVTVLPLGFCMGVPFPTMLERIKEVFADKTVSIFVAVNSVASAFGIVFGLYLSIALGFVATALIGVACYAAAMLLLFIVLRTAPAGRGAAVSVDI